MRQLKLYDMETFSDPELSTHGDCFRACFKTLYQIDAPLAHPIGPDGHWNPKFLRAIERRNLVMNGRQWRADRDYNHLPRVLIASGLTERTPYTQANHAVIWDRVANRMIHDPHPSREGLLSVEWFYYFERLE